MVYIFLLTTEASDRTIAGYMKDLGLAFRQATANALGDIDPAQVPVLRIKLSGTDDMLSMRILAVGNITPEREQKLKEWSAYLSKAWRTFANQHLVDWVDQVDVCTVAINGYSMMATETNVQKYLRFL